MKKASILFLGLLFSQQIAIGSTAQQVMRYIKYG